MDCLVQGLQRVHHYWVNFIFNVNLKKIQLKYEQMIWIDFFSIRYTNGQQAYEKMFNIINHREMQIKTTMR